METLLHSNPRLQNVLSFVIRTSNTFVGRCVWCWLPARALAPDRALTTTCLRSLLWVDYIRFIGLQPAKK